MAARGQTSYYEILGVESSVSQDAVSKGECLSMLMAYLARRSSSSLFAPCLLSSSAYRKRALQTHPDRGGNEAEFKKVAE